MLVVNIYIIRGALTYKVNLPNNMDLICNWGGGGGEIVKLEG